MFLVFSLQPSVSNNNNDLKIDLQGFENLAGWKPLLLFPINNNNNK